MSLVNTADFLRDHPERHNCRNCYVFMTCLLAYPRNNVPCKSFGVAPETARYYRENDAKERSRRAREEDIEKYALAPCPFCGGSAHFEIDHSWVPTYCVSCDDIDCRGHKTADGGDPESKEDAAKMWNKRKNKKDTK